MLGYEYSDLVFARITCGWDRLYDRSLLVTGGQGQVELTKSDDRCKP